MIKFIVAVLMSFSLAMPVRADVWQELGYYGFASAAVFLNQYMIGLSKKLAKINPQNPAPVLQIIIPNTYEMTGTLIASLAYGFWTYAGVRFVESAHQQLMPHLPDSLVPAKVSACENKLRVCEERASEERRMLGADQGLQIERINQMKHGMVIVKLQSTLEKIDRYSKSDGEDNSRKIAAQLWELAEAVMALFPGFTNEDRTFLSKSNFKVIPSGETFIYDAKLINGKIGDFVLPGAVSVEVIRRLVVRLERLCKTQQSEKAEYFIRFWKIFGIEVVLPAVCQPVPTPNQPDL